MTRYRSTVPAAAMMRTIMLLVGLGLFGCQSMQSMLSSMDKPTASIQGVHLQDLSLSKATLLFDVAVSNPYSLPLPLVNLDYTLASGGAKFLTGKADVAGTIPAGQSKVISLPATIAFADLLGVVKGVKPGAVVPYEAAMNLSVNAPAIGPIGLPLSKSGQIPVPAVPEVELAGVQWKNLDLTQAAAVISLKIKNTNSFPVDLNKLGYQLSLGGSPIVTSSIAQATQFTQGAQNTIDIPISFSPANLGLAAFNVLRGKGARYDLSGAMDLATPFGPLSVPYSRSGQTSFRR